MNGKWLVERASDGGPMGANAALRLEQIEKTHDIVSVTPDPYDKHGLLIVAKKRAVGFDA